MELKPCPFCGGEATLEYDGARKGTHSQSCIVLCLECGCTLESNEEGDSCGRQWNTRYKPYKLFGVD